MHNVKNAWIGGAGSRQVARWGVLITMIIELGYEMAAYAVLTCEIKLE